MTERLYYHQQRQTVFSATIVGRLAWEGQPAVVLDRTAFYPASGGQPADRGELDGVAVVDVVVRDLDGEIVHVLAKEVPSGTVQGVVDWGRRFDHMQQHSGQHVLSAAFERVLDADTVGSHLGSETSTIDVNVARLDGEVADEVEWLANRVVWDDRQVAIRFISPTAVAALPLRRPPTVDGPVRIVEIGATQPGHEPSFDLNPCGGTHVARTGEIGLIKVVRLDYRGDQTRVEFLCGGRALRDYRNKSKVVTQLASSLTVGHWELDLAIARLRDEAKSLRRQLAAAEKRVVEAEAVELARDSADLGLYRVVSGVWEERPAAALRSLALALVEQSRLVAVLASVGERTQLCFARSEGVEVDVAALLRRACARLEGKGGGRPHLAQGSAGVIDLIEVKAALSEIVLSLSSGDDGGRARGPVGE